MFPKEPPTLRTSPEVLRDEVQHFSVRDVDSKPVEQELVVNGSIVGLNIRLEDECMLRQILSHLPYSKFAATMSFEMGTLLR